MKLGNRLIGHTGMQALSASAQSDQSYVQYLLVRVRLPFYARRVTMYDLIVASTQLIQYLGTRLIKYRLA